MDKVVLVSNLKMLLIFLLINRKKIDEIGFIFEKGNELPKKLKNIYCIKKQKNILKILISRIINYILLNNLKKKWKFNSKSEIYGAAHISGANYFLNSYFFYLLEDGTYDYSEKVIRKNINNKNIKKIYLTGIAPILKEIPKKVEIINLKQLWNNKTKNEQQEILEIFSFNKEIIEDLKERNIILYTQPLSEDRIISEKEKIELYSKIISNYPREKLLLKIHPREKTNYKEIFKEILILEQNFPAELFELLEIKFEKGVTLFSTAVLNSGLKEIDFYGTEVHYNILKKFGSMDHIMKRNKFL